MTILNTLLALILPLSLGYGIIALVTKNQNLPHYIKLALGFGIGTATIAHWMILLAYANIPFTSSTINIPLIGVTILLLMLSVTRRQKNNRLPRPKDTSSIRWINILSGAFILFIFVHIFWTAITFPIFGWDTFSTMGFKGKVIYYDQSIRNLSYVTKPAYPIHLPLTISWISYTIGVWNDQSIKFIFPITCLCFALIQYFFLRFFVSSKYSLFGVVLLLSSNFLAFHSTIAYRDITMMYFNCSALMLLILWYTKKCPNFWILAAIFSGITATVKTEGLGYLAVHTLVFIFLLYNFPQSNAKSKLTKLISFIVINFGIYSIYNIYRELYIIPAIPMSDPSQAIHFELDLLKLDLSAETLLRTKIVLRRYVENIILSGNWNIVWPMFFVSCFNLLKEKPRTEVTAIFLALASTFTIYLFSFVLTQHYFWVGETRTVLSRSILHSYPLICILIILLNFTPGNQSPENE